MLLAGCLLVVAFLVGGHWVDVGDSTCGGVYRPDLWFDDDRCRGRMLVRAGGVLVITAGAVLLAVALRRSSSPA
ncbi:MAG TPA: hypothetical protein VG078_06210 [Acidimicrobiales bacterium]|nr:hypothetical protein [Acidimicrobiales bacterium]